MQPVQPTRPTQSMPPMPPMPPTQPMRPAPRGVAMVEALIGLPVLCLLGLAVLQIALLMHARDGLHFALLEAARAGSVAHASRDAIERGLARGLAPLLPSAGVADADLARLRAAGELRAGLAAGWIRLRRLSPTRESFFDWGETARDDAGVALDATEIPIDNLPTEATRRQPASGTTAQHAGAPIGQASGQTLADASLLQLELVYGVPVDVPLVGALLTRTLAAMDGCEAASAQPLGAIDLGRARHGPSARASLCAFYRGPDPAGRMRSRVPVRVVALIRMQTPPRLDADTPARGAAG